MPIFTICATSISGQVERRQGDYRMHLGLTWLALSPVLLSKDQSSTDQWVPLNQGPGGERGRGLNPRGIYAHPPVQKEGVYLLGEEKGKNQIEQLFLSLS